MTLNSFPQCQNILVIGYGNELRGDDAVGPHIANLVSAWEAANVRAIAVPQLTPELAAKIRNASCIVFVDAAHEALDRVRVQSVRCDPAVDSSVPSCNLSHAITPAKLLALSQLLYGSHPRAWIMEIPAENFQLGDVFSPQTQAGIKAALVEMEHILRQGELCQIQPMVEVT